jgi:hypothetical protein
MAGRGVYVKLKPSQIEFADDIAARRSANAERYGLFDRITIPDNGKDAHILGARCELAAKIYLDPVEWNAYSEGNEHINKPDLAGWIDVKGTVKEMHSLCVPANKLEDKIAYLLVSAEDHPYYWIAGWQWGRSIREKYKPEKRWVNGINGYGPPAYYLAPTNEYLRWPHELLKGLHRKRIRPGQKETAPKGGLSYA